jgi:hypothetical protein
MELQVKTMEKNIFDKVGIDNINKYVFTHSGEFKKTGVDFNSGRPHITEGYVKITANGKTIYRKLVGANIKGGQIQMSYRSMKELNIKKGRKVNKKKVVNVEKTCWFKYYWCNSDSGVRAPFIIAFISLALAVISSLITIYDLLLNATK